MIGHDANELRHHKFCEDGMIYSRMRIAWPDLWDLRRSQQLPLQREVHQSQRYKEHYSNQVFLLFQPGIPIIRI